MIWNLFWTMTRVGVWQDWFRLSVMSVYVLVWSRAVRSTITVQHLIVDFQVKKHFAYVYIQYSHNHTTLLAYLFVDIHTYLLCTLFYICIQLTVSTTVTFAPWYSSLKRNILFWNRPCFYILIASVHWILYVNNLNCKLIKFWKLCVSANSLLLWKL